MTNTRYFIFGRSSCPFCAMASDYCQAISANYTYLDFEGKEDILEDYKKFYNHPTVPIILANNIESGLTVKLGGYTDLIDHNSEKEGK